MAPVQTRHEGAARGDGYRVLVDRLWPRGVKKEALQVELWAKDLAPSPALRKWFGHDPARFREFARSYHAELAAPPARELLADLTRRASRGTVTLVYGAHDEDGEPLGERTAVVRSLRPWELRLCQVSATR